MRNFLRDLWAKFIAIIGPVNLCLDQNEFLRKGHFLCPRLVVCPRYIVIHYTIDDRR